MATERIVPNTVGVWNTAREPAKVAFTTASARTGSGLPAPCRTVASSARRARAGQHRSARHCVAAPTTSVIAPPLKCSALLPPDTAFVLAHVDIAEKSNEIPVAQVLLAELGIAVGAIVTLDAMHCQKNISRSSATPALPSRSTSPKSRCPLSVPRMQSASTGRRNHIPLQRRRGSESAGAEIHDVGPPGICCAQDAPMPRNRQSQTPEPPSGCAPGTIGRQGWAPAG